MNHQQGFESFLAEQLQTVQHSLTASHARLFMEVVERFRTSDVASGFALQNDGLVEHSAVAEGKSDRFLHVPSLGEFSCIVPVPPTKTASMTAPNGAMPMPYAMPGSLQYHESEGTHATRPDSRSGFSEARSDESMMVDDEDVDEEEAADAFPPEIAVQFTHSNRSSRQHCTASSLKSGTSAFTSVYSEADSLEDEDAKARDEFRHRSSKVEKDLCEIAQRLAQGGELVTDNNMFAITEDIPEGEMSRINTQGSSASLTSQGHTFKFELLPSWSKAKAKKAMVKSAITQRQQSRDLNTRGSGEKAQKNRWVIHPYSPSRIVWDTLSLCLVTYDCAMLPLMLLDPPTNTFTTLMSWLTRIFWTMDLFLSFNTGFLQSDGSLQLSNSAIIRNYVCTWFLLDVSLVALDWVEVFSGIADGVEADAAGAGRMGKTGRAFRVIRMMRLLRLARMKEIIKAMTFRLQSERLSIIADIVKILIIVMATAHLLACCWYGICNAGTLRESNWIVLTGAASKSLEHRYLMSMHWSLSQFSGGMDEFKPSELSERLFAVLAFLLAFMMCAICVSALTSSMTRLHILSSRQSRQLSMLRRYLIQNGISDKLTIRVQRNALHAIAEQQRLMNEKHVELLQAISEPLRVELHFEMYSPVLAVHPFFEALTEECPPVIQKTCHIAMSTLLVSNGDILFNAGEIPETPKMYILCNGLYDYTQYAEVVFPVTTMLYAEQWLAEACLWVPWMYRGVLKAGIDGRVCVLDSTLFGSIVRQFDHPDIDPKNYAVEFVKELNDRMETSQEVSDMAFGKEEEFVETVESNQRKTAALAGFSQKGTLQNILEGVQTKAKSSSRRPSMMDSRARQRQVRRHSVLLSSPTKHLSGNLARIKGASSNSNGVEEAVAAASANFNAKAYSDAVDTDDQSDKTGSPRSVVKAW
jgi:hypothetical protein